MILFNAKSGLGLSALSNMHEGVISVSMQDFIGNRAMYQFRNVEGIYQCAKMDPKTKGHIIRFSRMDGFEAKRAGKHLDLRSDWDDVKDRVMWHAIKAKFDQNYQLRDFLLKTGDEKLVHDCPWGDRYWGVTNGEGRNQLGIMLMVLRDQYNDQMRAARAEFQDKIVWR